MLCCESKAYLSKKVFPGNWAVVFIWKNFHFGWPALSYEHIEFFTKEVGLRRDLGNQPSPVNRAHIERPLIISLL